MPVSIMPNEKPRPQPVRPVRTLLTALPELLRVTSKGGLRYQLRFILVWYKMARKHYLEQLARRSRPQVGNPAMRLNCCGSRPARYQEFARVANIPELAGILVPAGTEATVEFFDCKMCGQEWVENSDMAHQSGIVVMQVDSDFQLLNLDEPK